MTSYQKLKFKCLLLERQLNIFKDVLTVYKGGLEAKKVGENTYFMQRKVYVEAKKELVEMEKLELNKWVAFNLDEKEIERLLKLKESMKNEKSNSLDQNW